MKKPSSVTEVYLQPGDFHFGDARTCIRTLLGSCVSITMWHPTRMIGGMCHFMLPSRTRSSAALDGKYADEAMEMFLQEIHRHRTVVADYQVKLFGGGIMFSGHVEAKHVNVANKNLEAAYAIFRENDIEPVTYDVGKNIHRTIIFNIWSGDVWLRSQSNRSLLNERN